MPELGISASGMGAVLGAWQFVYIFVAIPLGFALLALQGVAEIIKRIAFLRGEEKLSREQPQEEI